MPKTMADLLQENNISIYRSSEERYKARCPFHEGDREPSFTVYPDDTYFCFGCRAWGNPVKFLIDFKGMSSKEALDYVGVEDYVFPKAEKRAIKIKNTLKTGAFLYTVADKYHNYLLSHPGPQKYLEDRGLTKETIAKFKIGYTDGAVLDFQFAEEYEMANEVGLLNKIGSEALTHRITIPNIIENKWVDFITGRTVINDKIKYYGLRMPKPICGFWDFRNSPILFLVEGNFDYLILRQWGYPAVVMSGSHINAVNARILRDKVIAVVPDNDDAGMKAARDIQRKLPWVQVIDYSKFGVKDIGELATQKDAESAFGSTVGEQLWEFFSQNQSLTKYMPSSVSLPKLV